MPILISADLLKNWRVTHCLNACSPIHISGSDFLTGEKLTRWMCIHPFSSVVLICSNTREQLTAWMHVYPILSVVSDPLKHWRATHSLDAYSSILVSGSLVPSNSEGWLTIWMHVHPSLSVVLIPSNTTHILYTCSPSLVSDSNLVKQWRATYILIYSQFTLLVRTPLHWTQSYLFTLQKHLSDFNNFCQMPHTYCQFYISLILFQHNIALTFCITCQSQMAQVKIIIDFT